MIPTTMRRSTKILPTTSARNHWNCSMNSRPRVNFRWILPPPQRVHQKRTVEEQEAPPNFWRMEEASCENLPVPFRGRQEFRCRAANLKFLRQSLQ